jgi:hypothetical protein
MLFRFPRNRRPIWTTRKSLKTTGGEVEPDWSLRQYRRT